MHVLALFLHVEAFGLKQQRLHTFLREEFDQSRILRQSVESAEQLVGAVRLLFFCGVRIGQNLLCFGQTLCHQALLSLVKLHHIGFQLNKLLVFAVRDRSADDQRCTGIVNQHGVDLVDDGVIVTRTLHHLFGCACHIVTQVVETELVVGAIGDVGVVCGTALSRVRLMLVDAVDGETQEVVKGSHPLRVTFGKVIVDCHHMHSPTGQTSQVNRQGCHQSFTFTGRHLGYLTLMQHYAAYDLHVVMHHIPTYGIAACHPAGVVTHNVTVDVDILAFSRKVTVEVGGFSLNHLVFLKPAGSLLQHRESLWHHMVQSLVNLFEKLLLHLVDLLVDIVLLLKIHVGIVLDTGLQSINLSLVFSNVIFDIFLKLDSLVTQAVDVQILNSLIRFERLVQ